MKMEKIRQVVYQVMNYCDRTDILLTDYIFMISDEIKCDINSEELIEELCDEKSKNFQKIIGEINRQIEKASNTSRILLEDNIDGYRIVLTDFGSKTKVSISKQMWESFDIISQYEKNKRGSIYEEFCCRFLNDLGLEAQTTPQSNDKGIDIFAKHNANLREGLSSLVFNDYIYLLGQAKFFKNRIDTPVIRKLVGDTLFLRFDKLEYLEIGHNAIHLIVFSHNGYTQGAIEFAESNKIMLLDSYKIVNIISASEKPKQWSSYNYLLTQAIN